jgi:hypothetical protein
MKRKRGKMDFNEKQMGIVVLMYCCGMTIARLRRFGDLFCGRELSRFRVFRLTVLCPYLGTVLGSEMAYVEEI